MTRERLKPTDMGKYRDGWERAFGKRPRGLTKKEVKKYRKRIAEYEHKYIWSQEKARNDS